jgi:hypothetical protein
VRRTWVVLAVLALWGGGLAALGRRQAAGRSDSQRLAEAGARITPGTMFFRIDRDGQQVGYVSSQVDTTADGFAVDDYLLADRPGPGRKHTTVISHVSMSRTFALRRFVVTTDTGSGVSAIAGTMDGDSVLTLTTTPPVSSGVPATTRRLAVPGHLSPLPPTVLPLAFALSTSPAVGRRSQFAVADPVDGPRDVTLAVAAESVFVLPDSAVLDSTAHRWRAVTMDTVRAWRVVPDSPLVGGGAPAVAWIDDQGRVVAAAATIEGTGSLTFQRTAYELAHDNWLGHHLTLHMR